MQSGSTPQIDDYFGNLEGPSAEDLQVQLQQLVQQGVLTPEDAEAALAGESAMAGVTTDPRMKQAQMDALSGLEDISGSGGMTTTDRANLQRIGNEESSQARGSRDAILQNAQSRGMGGSGMEIMAQLQNGQDSATRQSQRDLDVAGMAQDRALQALMQGGQTAGNIRSQDFSEGAQRATAQDAISKFNAQNQQQVNMANTMANNNAQQANLNAKQGIHNANVGTGNQQSMMNSQLQQQQYENELKKRQGQAGIGGQNAANAGRDSQAQADAWNRTIGTGLSAAGMFAGKQDGGLVDGEQTGMDSEARMLQPGEFVVRKDDVPDMLKKMHTGEDGEFDVAGFLDQITGGRHQYGGKKGRAS